MTTIYDAAILLVDDNPDLLTLVTDNLRTAGYKTVCTAADCTAARAAFAAHRPDLMILDINLPDGDGFGLFRTLRTHSADRIGRPGAVSLGAGRRRGQAVRAGTWRG